MATLAVVTANSQSGLSFIEYLVSKENSGLKQGKFKIRGIVRDASKIDTVKQTMSKHLASNESADSFIEFTSGVDAKDIPSVEAALKGSDLAFLVTPLADDRGTLERNMIQAAYNAGVQHVVLVTSWTSSLDDEVFKDEFLRSEQLAEKLFGSNAVVLRPGYFFTNFLTAAATISKQNAFYLPARSHKLGLIHPDDIGSVGAEVSRQIVLSPSFNSSLTGKVNSAPTGSAKIINVIGPEALTAAEVATIFSDVLQREIKFVDVSIDQMTAGLKSNNAPQSLIHFLVVLWEKIHEGGDIHMAADGETARILGKASNFKDWVIENKDKFASKN